VKYVLLLLIALPAGATDVARLERDLNEIARVAASMVDGDICERIVTARALRYMSHPDPRDQYADGDNYDVDDDAFIRTKKTLIRLANLADYPVDVNLWMPLKGDPPRVQVVIRNKYEMSQFWDWGKLNQPMFPAMKAVLETGRPMTVKEKPTFVSVLAPVRNSLGQIVGLVEVVGQTTNDARENVK
jgi:hypothetical protein